jgi:hypothetical protein
MTDTKACRHVFLFEVELHFLEFRFQKLDYSSLPLLALLVAHKQWLFPTLSAPSFMA